jgi:peptide/nickel transport system substrate-binding protein
LVVVYPAVAPYEEESVAFTNNVFESLVQRDELGNLRPGLAQSWYNPDEFTWVFELRDGLRRHDGKAVTAAEVVDALEADRSQPFLIPVAKPMERVEVLDDRRFRIRTRYAFGPLARYLTRFPIRLAAVAQGERTLGTGPYRIESWEEGKRIELVAFEGHFAGAPPNPRVTFLVVNDSKQRVRQISSGEAHLALDVSHRDLPELARAPRARVTTVGGLRLLFLGLDCAREKSAYISASRNPFKDVRVRRAVARAIDRSALLQEALGGMGRIAARAWETGIQAPGLTEGEPFDPASARALLAEAGFGSGFTVTLDYTQGRLRDADLVVQRLTADLGRVGIKVEPRPTPDLIKRLWGSDTAFFLSRAELAPTEIDLHFSYFVHTRQAEYGALNAGGYSNSEVDAWIEEAFRTLLPEERGRLMGQVAAEVARDLPLIPLVVPDDIYAADGRLEFRPRADRRVELAGVRWRAVGGARATR